LIPLPQQPDDFTHRGRRQLDKIGSLVGFDIQATEGFLTSENPVAGLDKSTHLLLQFGIARDANGPCENVGKDCNFYVRAILAI